MMDVRPCSLLGSSFVAIGPAALADLPHWQRVALKRNAVKLPGRLLGLGLRFLQIGQNCGIALLASIRGAWQRQCNDAKRKEVSDSSWLRGSIGIMHRLQYWGVGSI